jgi:hypothetical protein
METVRIDYLTVKLSPSFTFGDWWNYSQSPILDERTGEICGVRIPQKGWRSDTTGKVTTISCYGAESEKLAVLALTNELDITRLDLALDIEAENNEQVEDNIKALYNRLEAYYLDKRRTIVSSYTTGTTADRVSSGTGRFGGNKSPYQIIIYNKSAHSGGNDRTRVEFRLKGKLAKTVWQIAKERYLSPKRLVETYASLEAKILKPGILGVNWNSATIHDIDRSEQKLPSKREQWIRTQVLSACIKEFYETGKNLPEILLEDFNNHFQAVAALNIDYQNTYAQLELWSATLAQTNENED